VEEDEARRVRRPVRAVEMLRVEGAAEAVGGEDVHAPVPHERRRAGHSVEDALHARPDQLLRRAATTRTGRMRRACEVEEMRSLGLVELKRAGERLQNALRNAARV